MNREFFSVLLLALTTTTVVLADSQSLVEWWSLHAQATYLPQGHGRFHSLYSGPNSLSADPDLQATITSTLFAGLRLWPGGAVYVNPEIDGGAGISTGFGVAGFPNGEGTRVGSRRLRPYLSRVFLRQQFSLSDENDRQVAEANELAGPMAKNRLTLTLGKYSATDVFDQNAYAHDPRTHFLNWALMDNAAWDYPANSRGFTWGATAELVWRDWSARVGDFLVPLVANGPDLNYHIGRDYGLVMEIERVISYRKRPGKLRVMGFFNRAGMGNYRTTLNTPAFEEDVTRSRAAGEHKYGYGINAEQELADGLGSFLRAGWNDGHTETWAFTEVDRTASVGITLNGIAWNRARDQIGLAGVVNALSPDHRQYLAAGGLGFIIGDGGLNYGTENILEAYYLWQVILSLSLTVDFQEIQHPAYNRDRGPAAIVSGRFHWAF